MTFRRRPGVGREHLDHVGAFAVAVDEQERWDAQALHRDVGGVGRHRPGRGAGDVGVVCAVGDIPDEPAGPSVLAVSDRADEGDVGQVRPAPVGVVDDRGHPGRQVEGPEDRVD